MPPSLFLFIVFSVVVIVVVVVRGTCHGVWRGKEEQKFAYIDEIADKKFWNWGQI